MPRNTQARHWMITLNNPGLDAVETCAVFELLNISYMWQYEEGENGTRHIQGYLGFAQPKRFNWIQSRLSENGLDGCHIENVRDRRNAVNYCRKEDTRVEGPFTNLSDYELDQAGQGRRRDLELLKKDIDEGKSMKTIADTHFSAFLMYNNGILRYRNLLQEPRSEKTKVIYLFGEPGTGKSRFAHLLAKHYCRENLPNDYYYKSSGKWWDHYENQTTVVWDDFRGCDYRLSELLKLMDRYPYKVEAKGTVLEFNSKVLVITSNLMYNALYEHGNEPIFRRIDLFLNVLGYENDCVRAHHYGDDEDLFSVNYVHEIIYDI